MSHFATKKIANKTALNDANKQYSLSDSLPFPLFKPRSSLVKQSQGVIEVCFLNKKRKLGSPVDWHPAELKVGTRLWLLNLHYMEFLEGLPDQEWLSVTLDWIHQNKPFRQGYWLDDWNSYSLSIRVVVWMQQLAVRSFEIEQQGYNLIIQSLVSQMRFLERNLEQDIGGNHLIKNIKALLWAGRFFEGRDALRWSKKGRQLLFRELGEQVANDGMHHELSPAYHCQVFADLLECYSVLTDYKDKERLADKLKTMAQNLIDLTHPDGMISLFNDGGLHMAYQPEDCLTIFTQLIDVKATASRHIIYPDSGYYGFRSGKNLVLFDCGPLSPDFLPAHGHGDALSFEWSVSGKRIIIDPGVYEYNPGKMRDLSRSTRSHNTVTVDNQDQSEFWKAFRVGRRARIVECDVLPTPGGLIVKGAHDGYARLSGSPVHCREITMEANRVVLKDIISGGEQQHTEARIMLAPGTLVTINESGATLQNGEIKISVISTSSICVEDAWCFLDFGYKQNTKQLVFSYGGAPTSGLIELAIIE